MTIRRSPLLIEFRDAKSKALINARIKVVVTVVYPLKHVFDTACTNAGIEGFWWHDLRATFGTRLGAAGVGMRTIMDLMGHRDPKTCLRYVRATEPAKREAVQYAFQRPGHKSDTPHLVAV